MDTSPLKSADPWRTQLRQRIGILLLVKSLGIPGWIAAFFGGYFWVLRHPLGELTIMPLTALDRLVAFRPEALVLYTSLWAYVSLAPALLKNFRELFSYGVATLAMSLAGLGIFLRWPTAVPAFDIDLAQNPLLSVLQGVDLAANACPSLHVSFAIFSGIWLDRVLREVRAPGLVRLLNWLWCAGIVYSTLAIRQHVVLDVIAGTVLGVVVAWLHLGALRRIERRADARDQLERAPRPD
jgi:membrane-associated phospholipid phosphatase